MASRTRDNDRPDEAAHDVDHDAAAAEQAEIAAAVADAESEGLPAAPPEAGKVSLPDGVDRVSVATGTFTSGDEVDPASAQLIDEAVSGGQPGDQGESD